MWNKTNNWYGHYESVHKLMVVNWGMYWRIVVMDRALDTLRWHSFGPWMICRVYLGKFVYLKCFWALDYCRLWGTCWHNETAQWRWRDQRQFAKCLQPGNVPRWSRERELSGRRKRPISEQRCLHIFTRFDRRWLANFQNIVWLVQI